MHSFSKHVLIRCENGTLFLNLFLPTVRKTCLKITRTIFLNSERSEQFLKQNSFLTCYWRFVRSNILEQLKCQS